MPAGFDITAGVTRHGFSFAQLKTDHFEVLYRNSDASADIVNDTGKMLEKAFDEFCTGFKDAGFKLNSVSHPLSWVVFDNSLQYRDFARVADGMANTYLESYYSAGNNHVVLMQVATTLGRTGRFSSESAERARMAGVSGMDKQPEGRDLGSGGMLDIRHAVHEAAHQLAFNTGLQTRGVYYPMWVSEGLATNFEADSIRDIGLAGENAPRQRQLLKAYEAGRLMRLRDFATLVQIPPDKADSANDLYAQSWALFRFLYKTRRAELQNYMTTLARLAPEPRDENTMYREFTAAFGQMSQLEKAWLDHVRSLRDGR
jgi:hypothetical protein